MYQLATASFYEKAAQYTETAFLLHMHHETAQEYVSSIKTSRLESMGTKMQISTYIGMSS